MTCLVMVYPLVIRRENLMINNYKIYKHTNQINGKVYIGLTNQKLDRRFRKNGKGYKYCSYFYNAIKKYGWENFSHELLLDNLSKEEACLKEKEFILKYKSKNDLYGYNLTEGGEGVCGRKHTPEEIARYRIANAGKNNPNYGNKWSEEQKKSLSEYKKAHPSLYWLGKKRDKETCRKISETRKRLGIQSRTKNIKATKVIKMDLQGKELKLYDLIIDAAKENNVARQSIGKCCLGKRKTAGGYRWKYANN